MARPTLFCTCWTLCVLSGVDGAATTAPDASMRYEHQTWRAENGLPQNSVHSMVQTAMGFLWLATEGGLAKFDGFRLVVYDSQNTPQLGSNDVRSVLEGSDRSLWIATADGLTRLQHNRFTSYSKAQGLPSSDVLSLALDRDQALLATTTEGSVRFENGRFVRTTPAAPRLPPEVKQTDVQTTLVEHLHRVWIGTNNGLLLLQDRRTRKIDLGGSLRPRRINALTEDRQGTLWIGTDHGVAKIIAGKVSWLNSPEAIAQDAILSFLEDRDGDIWIGTDPTGVTVLRDPLFTSFGRDDGLPDDLIRCVPANSGGTLRVGTKDGHFDLRGMRERAEVIDAKLHVATAARHGTCIRLEVPLP